VGRPITRRRPPAKTGLPAWPTICAPVRVTVEMALKAFAEARCYKLMPRRRALKKPVSNPSAHIAKAGAYSGVVAGS
jgi:hypothetical protein